MAHENDKNGTNTDGGCVKEPPTPTPSDCLVIERAAFQEATSRLATAIAADTTLLTALAAGSKAFATAKKAQRQAFDDLEELVARVKKTLDCKLDSSTRCRLEDCFKDKDKDCSPCPDVDASTCNCFCCEDITSATEHPSLSDVEACVEAAQKDADALKDLPTKLETRISDVQTALKALEDDLCEDKREPERAYVEYLILMKKVNELKKIMGWTEAQYTKAFKKAIDLLRKRHRILVCIAATEKGREAFDAEVAKRTSGPDDLIDSVLECLTDKGGEDQDGKDENGCDDEGDKDDGNQSDDGDDKGGGDKSAQTTQRSTSSSAS